MTASARRAKKHMAHKRNNDTAKASVRDVPEPKPEKLSEGDLQTLREAGYGELAELVAPYVSH